MTCGVPGRQSAKVVSGAGAQAGLRAHRAGPEAVLLLEAGQGGQGPGAPLPDAHDGPVTGPAGAADPALP